MSVYFLFFFFLRKNCEPTKTQIKPKPTKKNKNKQTKNNKVKNFLHTETSKMVKVVYFAFWWFFYAENVYGKKIKQAWNCSDNLIYYITEMYPHQSIYRELFLYALIFNCVNLWSFVKIFLNSFFTIICEIYLLKCLWKQASVCIPSFKINLLSSKHDIGIFLIPYVPSLCFLLWIFSFYVRLLFY